MKDTELPEFRPPELDELDVSEQKLLSDEELQELESRQSAPSEPIRKRYKKPPSRRDMESAKARLPQTPRVPMTPPLSRHTSPAKTVELAKGPEATTTLPTDEVVVAELVNVTTGFPPTVQTTTPVGFGKKGVPAFVVPTVVASILGAVFLVNFLGWLLGPSVDDANQRPIALENGTEENSASQANLPVREGEIVGIQPFQSANAPIGPAASSGGQSERSEILVSSTNRGDQGDEEHGRSVLERTYQDSLGILFEELIESFESGYRRSSIGKTGEETLHYRYRVDRMRSKCRIQVNTNPSTRQKYPAQAVVELTIHRQESQALSVGGISTDPSMLQYRTVATYTRSYEYVYCAHRIRWELVEGNP